MVKIYRGTFEPENNGPIIAAEFVNAEDYRKLEAALGEIATGLMPEDSAADHHNRYELCAARLCGIARRAITLETEGK